MSSSEDFHRASLQPFEGTQEDVGLTGCCADAGYLLDHWV
jgi:hypothetical protein